MKELVQLKAFEIYKKKFGLIIVSLENAISLFVYEDIPTFGSFGISVPATTFMPASTLFITGKDEDYSVRIIGEKIATKIQKLVLVSLNVKNVSNNLLSEIIKKIEENLFMNDSSKKE